MTSSSTQTRPTARRLVPSQNIRQEQSLAAVLALFGDQDGQQSAARCIAEFGSLSAVLDASVADICTRANLDPNLAEALQLVALLYREATLEEIAGREPIASFAALRLYALRRLRGRATEQFVALLLDRRNGLIREHIVAEGTMHRIDVYPREVVRAALLYNATAVILLHNHPSGDPTPSADDIDFTQQVAGALAMLGIAFHDHLVVGHNDIVSFRAWGAL